MDGDINTNGFIYGKTVIFKFSNVGSSSPETLNTSDNLVPFNTIDFEVNAENSLVNNKFVAPVSGYYFISGTVEILIRKHYVSTYYLTKEIHEDNKELEKSSENYNRRGLVSLVVNHDNDLHSSYHGSTIFYLYKNDRACIQSVSIMNEFLPNGSELHGYLIST